MDVAADQQENVGFVAGHRALPESVAEADSALSAFEVTLDLYVLDFEATLEPL